MITLGSVAKAGKTGRPAMGAEDAERVRKGMTELLPRFAGVNAKLGRAIGISGQAVGQILNDRQAPSLSTAQKVAALLGVPWTTLVQGAPVPDMDETDPYPLRRELRLLSEFRGAPSEVRAFVLSIKNRTGDYARIDDWLAELRAAQRRYERGELEDLRPDEEFVEIEDKDG